MIIEVLTWILNNISCTIQSKKDTLILRKLGVASDGEPKVMWVKMINHHTEYDKVLTLRSRFNNILEQLLFDRKHHYIMDVNGAVDSSNCFTSRNRLTAEGETCFWHEVDQQIEKFEYKKLSLKPQQQNTVQGSGSSRTKPLKRNKMPFTTDTFISGSKTPVVIGESENSLKHLLYQVY